MATLRDLSIADMEREKQRGITITPSVKVTKTAIALENYRDEIIRRGMSRDLYVALEGLQPGILSGVDPRRLTVNHSSTCQHVALEAIKKSGVLERISSGGIAYLFNQLVEFLQNKILGFKDLGLGKRYDEAWVRARRTADNVRRQERDFEQHIAGLKREYVFDAVFDGVVNSLASKQDRRVTEILSAMEDSVIRSTADAAVPLTALAIFAKQNDAYVADYRIVADRMTRNGLMQKYPAQVMGLGVTKMGLPGGLLLGRMAGITPKIGSELFELAQACQDLAQNFSGSLPAYDEHVPKWVADVMRDNERCKAIISKNRQLGEIVERFAEEQGFSEMLTNYSRSTIGFWHGTRHNPQGDMVIDPEDSIPELESVFELNKKSEMSGLARDVDRSIDSLSKALASLRKVNDKRLDPLLGSHNKNSKAIREIIRDMRRQCTTVLRLAKLFETYINANIRAFKFTRQVSKVYMNTASRYNRISCK